MEESLIDSLKILQYLKSNSGLLKKISISPLVDDFFPTPIQFSESQYKLRQLNVILGTLLEKGLIKNLENPSPNGNTYTWAIRKDIKMELTIDGDRYLTENLYNEKEFEVNKLTIDSQELTKMVHKSVIDTNRKTVDILSEQAIANELIATNSTHQAKFSEYQTWIAAFTGLFILCSLGATVYSILRDNQIASLEQALLKKELTIRKDQKDILLLRSDTSSLGRQLRTLKNR